MLQNISEVGEGALELPAVDSLRRLARVLEGDAEVAAAGARRLCTVDCGAVANLPPLINSNARAEVQAQTDVPYCRVLWVLVEPAVGVVFDIELVWRIACAVSEERAARVQRRRLARLAVGLGEKNPAAALPEREALAASIAHCPHAFCPPYYTPRRTLVHT